MRVRNSDGHQAGFHEGVLVIYAPEDHITLGPTLAHALGRAMLVYANRNGVGRETLDEPPLPPVPVGDANAVDEAYRRAVRDLTVASPGSDPDATR